ncbi:MAG: hypothetical protein GX562_01335 [Coriobacteriaceae bacterium]|nr:hypothetical protein [Coriobacteriaceae bacterium]
MSAYRRTSLIACDRIRVAVATIVIILLAVAILTFQHVEQELQHKLDVFGYLLDQRHHQPRDPLGISDAVGGDALVEDMATDQISASDIDTATAIPRASDSISLAVTCIGVSKDKQIVGYSVDASLQQAACEFDSRVRRLGWLLQSDNRQGLCTYQLCRYENQGSISSQYALVVYCERKNVTSIVVELM